MSRRLLDEGFEVRALVRSKNRVSDLDGMKVELAEGDVSDFDSVESACRGVSAVFHLAGLIAYRSSQRAAMERVNVTGTKNIIRAIQSPRGAHGKARLLHMSSVTAVGAGFSPQQVLDESSPFNLHHLQLGYFETKWAAEQAVLRACREGLLDAVIINPSTVYGPGDAKKGSRKSQLKVAQGRLPFYPPGGVNVVHVDDVVELCMRVFKKGQSGDRTIASGENLLIKDVFDVIAQLSGVKPPTLQLPRRALLALGHFGDGLERIGLDRIGVRGPISLENAWTAILYHWFHNKKAREEFGFNPRPANEALEASIRWSKDHNYI